MIRKALLNLIRVDNGNPIFMLTRGYMDEGEFIAAWWIYLSDKFARGIEDREIDTHFMVPYKINEAWRIGFYAEVEGLKSILGNQDFDMDNYNENLSSLGAGCMHLTRFA